MPWDIAVELEDRPGTLASLGEATGAAGVNVMGLCGSASDGAGVIHILVDDAEQATSALEAAGLSVGSSREVLVIDVVDEPGAMGKAARRFGDAGVNIDLVYLATDTRLVFGVDNLDAARALA